MAGSPTVSEKHKNTEYNAFRLLQALRRSIQAIEAHSRQLITQFQITGPQLHCLRMICQEPGLTVADLARKLALSPGTIRGMVKRMEFKGLIQRQQDSADKRLKQIHGTPQGSAIVSTTPLPLEHQVMERLDSLTGSEQEQIVRALETVVDMMGGTHLDAAPLLETGPIDQTTELKQAVHLLQESHRQAQILDNQPAPGTPAVKNPLIVKRAQSPDMPLVASFIQSADAWYAAIIHEDDLDEYQMNEDWIQKNFQLREFYIGYTQNHEPVGTVSIQTFGDALYLGYVYVDAKFVGKSYGHQLLDFVRDTAKTRNIQSIYLLAHPRATWAVKAYQKYGFKLYLPYEEDILTWQDGALKHYYENGFQLYRYEIA